MSFAAFVTLVAAVVPAAAQLPIAPPAPPMPAKLERNLSTLWIVMPATEPAGREVSVKSGELIMKQRLIPAGLAKLTGSAVDPEGKFELTSGAELFRVQSGVPVYCIAGKRAPGGVAKWLVGGGSSQLCLVDADSDGRFEGEFTTASAVGGLPTIAGKRPKEADPLVAPVAYERADPSTMTTQYWVGIEYQGKPLLYNRRNFAVSFGTDKSDSSLTDWVYTGAEMPASQTLLGATWTVLALEEDRLKVRIDQPIPPQPFGIVQTTTYRFY